MPQTCSCATKIKEGCATLPIDENRYCKVVDTCAPIANNPVSTIYPGGDAEKIYTSLVNTGDYTEAEGILDGASETQLKNQIKYSLCEIASARMKCQGTAPSPGQDVWSDEWWYQNIWGTNQVQRTIYLLSLLTVFYLNAKIMFGMIVNQGETNVFNQIAPALAELPTAFDIPQFVPILLMVISFVVMTVVTISYTVKSKGDTPAELKAKRKEGGKILGIVFVVSTLLSGVLNFVTGANGNGDIFGVLTGLVNIFLFSLFVLFNFAFSAYIPQLMLVGIILQRFLLGSWTSTINFIFKTVAVLAIVGIIIAYWGVAKASGTVLATVFLLGFLLPTLLVVGVRWMQGGGGAEVESVWSLVLMPFFNLFINASSRKDMWTSGGIGVSNSDLFGTGAD